MKKFFAVFLMLVTLMSCAIPAYASDDQVYVDRDNGTVLTLPGHWTVNQTQDPLMKVKFTTDEAGVMLMTYGALDLWSDMDPSARAGYSRKDLNNSLFDESDIARILGCETGEVSVTTLGSNTYFLADTTHTTKVSGMSFTVSVRYWVSIHQGWMYIFQYSGTTTDGGPAYTRFKAMIGSAELGSGGSSGGSGSVYDQAVQAYNEGRYSAALSLFSQVPNEKSSQDYMRLIRIRSYGRNRGIGVVYDYSKALTSQEKADIDAAAKNFSFADTAQVLLSNTDVATYFLYGNWNTASNAPAYSYLRWHKDSVGGYYYTRSNNISTAVSDCVSIEDGYVRVSITSSNTLVFYLKLTGPDTLELYSYEYNKTVTLYRQ